MTDGQSASLSSYQAPPGTQDQIFVTVRQLRVCWCGAPSVTSGRVCHLQLLLGLASAVILGSVGRSVKLLLAFANTAIPGFSLLEIHE
jgi:hypothetical protein